MYFTIASNSVSVLFFSLLFFFSYTTLRRPLKLHCKILNFFCKLSSLTTAGAPLNADWNNSKISLFPTCKYARPGSLISAANGDFKTSLLSSWFWTFRHSLNFELLQICSLTCPAFCVAKIKWIPRLLPILAALINSFINSGCSAFNSANSSTTITKCGNGIWTFPSLYNLIYLSIWFTLASANKLWRFNNSAFIDFKDLSISFPSIFVIAPIKCGKSLNWFTIPPPLKSMITNPIS